MRALAALATIAALYHALNHAFMKSLLFLGTGAVLHSTGSATSASSVASSSACPGPGGSRWSACSRSPACRRSTASCRSGCCCRRFCSRSAVPQTVRQHAAAAARGRARARGGARRLRDGQVLRRICSSVSRARPTSRRRTTPAVRAHGLAWLAAGACCSACFRRRSSARSSRSTDAVRRHALDRRRRHLVAARPAQRGRRELRPADLPGGHRRGRAADRCWSCALLSRPRAPRRPLGLRLPLQTRGCRTRPRASGSRSATSSSRSSVIERELPTPFDAAPRYRVRSRAIRIWHWLYCPLGALVQRVAAAVGRAAGTHRRLPDVQLRHAARAAALVL